MGVFGLNTFDAHLHALGGMCVFTLVHKEGSFMLNVAFDAFK